MSMNSEKQTSGFEAEEVVRQCGAFGGVIGGDSVVQKLKDAVLNFQRRSHKQTHPLAPQP
eukprot:2486938-Amphidinium_carterae.1